MVTKEDRFFKVAVTVLIIAILATLAYRFTRTPGNQVLITDMAGFEIKDAFGDAVPFAGALDGKDEVYCLMVALSNCERCIYKAMADMESLQKAGKHVMVVVIHDWDEEVRGWSAHYPGIPVYSVPVATFYDNVQTPYLPVLLTFRKGAIRGQRFITNT